MPKIEFRGKIYNNEFEMPPEERKAYTREKEHKAENSQTGTKPLTEIVDMSPEVRAIYERALGNVEERLAASSRPLKDLPKTEDIYRQSAPADMKDLPSDESIYRPSPPLINSVKSTSVIEPDHQINRFVSSLLWLLLLLAVAFFVARFVL